MVSAEYMQSFWVFNLTVGSNLLVFLPCVYYGCVAANCPDGTISCPALDIFPTGKNIHRSDVCESLVDVFEGQKVF
jgi:hypothetical protein